MRERATGRQRGREVLSFLDVQSIVASTKYGARDSAAEARPGKTSGILADSAGRDTVIPTPALSTSGSDSYARDLGKKRWRRKRARLRCAGNRHQFRDGETGAGGPGGRKEGRVGEVYRADKSAISAPRFINARACTRFSSLRSLPFSLALFSSPSFLSLSLSFSVSCSLSCPLPTRPRHADKRRIRRVFLEDERIAVSAKLTMPPVAYEGTRARGSRSQIR